LPYPTAFSRAVRISGFVLLGLVVLMIIAIVYGFLAPLRMNYVWKSEDQGRCVASLPAPADTFVGLALSGGGSRAAIFGAAGMQALDEAGILDQITHVSSVSGGGFPASYLALKALPDCAPGTPCRAAFFDTMMARLQKNYFRRMMGNQVIHPNRAFSPSRRVTSLQNALDHPDFLDGKTFGDLTTARQFYFNGVSYDFGRRFVFSNAPVPDPADDPAMPLASPLRTLSFSAPNCMAKTPDDLPISLAVATSAAFPPVLGPITIQVPAADKGQRDQYWHLGDGGVIENTGVETLQEAAIRAARANPAIGKAIILSFNAGLRLDPETSVHDPDPSLWSRDPGRLVDVANARAEAFRAGFLARAGDQFGVEIEVIEFDYLDARDVPWPIAECGAHNSRDDQAELRRVPTDLTITACHAALMKAAARKLVSAALRDGGALAGLAASAQ